MSLHEKSSKSSEIENHWGKIACFGPQLQLWASWTRNPRISSSSSRVTVTSMSNAAGGCSQMSQASIRSGWLILMALSSANLDFVMSTSLQSKHSPLSFEGETMRVEKHKETRKRKPNRQHKWDILQDESLRNSYSYNKRKFAGRKVWRTWPNVVACSVRKSHFAKVEAVGSAEIRSDRNCTEAFQSTQALPRFLWAKTWAWTWQEGQTNGFTNISTFNERWKHVGARFAHQFCCRNLSSMGDFLSRTDNIRPQTWPAKSLSLHINQQRTSVLHVTARRKSDLYTTGPKIKLIIPSSQTNIQGQSSPPLTPSQFIFSQDFSHLLRVFGNFGVFSNSFEVPKFFIFGCCSKRFPMLGPRRSLHGKCCFWGAEWLPGPYFQGILPNATKSLGNKGTIWWYHIRYKYRYVDLLYIYINMYVFIQCERS